jgi:hypothetical protein
MSAILSVVKHGLEPSIHVFPTTTHKDVDGWDKPVHDGFNAKTEPFPSDM